MKYKKIVIGIDQSYTRTGISIAADGKLLKVTSIDFKGLRFKSEKRKHLYNIINKIIILNKSKANEMLLICERIRTFTGGTKLRPNYLKTTGALIAVIVDAAFKHGIEVYSADTRSWKSQIVGTSKGGKMPTIQFVKRLGFDVSYKDKKGNIKYNDDASDSACIALYGFCKNRKLRKED